MPTFVTVDKAILLRKSILQMHEDLRIYIALHHNIMIVLVLLH